MEDEQILNLYFSRSEQAIGETASKYGPYCHSIAMHVLENEEDAEECVSDTWFSAWNSIPPQSPRVLATFLGSITRNLAIDRWRRRSADKRGGGELTLVLDELAGCVSGAESPETDLMRKEVAAALNRFLQTLPEQDRTVLLCRYYFANTQREISQKTGLTENSVKSSLRRSRKALGRFLEKEGLV